MPRMVKSGLIQCSLAISEGEGSIEEIMEAMFQKHVPFIEEAGKKGVQILCLQEIFNTPYFCPGQDKEWYKSAETIPGHHLGSAYHSRCKLPPFHRQFGTQGSPSFQA